MDKWDYRFLEMAELVASWSKDPSTKVGAVIADDKNRVVSLGFNGFPRGINDDEELYKNREEKYKRVLHAEQNALIFSHKRNLSGCTLYIHPIPPCNRCSLDIIQHGISRVVSYQLTKHDARWSDSCNLSLKLLEEAGIKIDLVPMEEAI